jgi:hypothetical protein
MDPYLEDPGVWPDVHHELMSCARELLTTQIRPRYFVRVELRVYVSTDDDPGRRAIVPDLRVLEQTPRADGRQPGAVATLEVAEPIAVTLVNEEVREARLEVIDREYREVVTVIEIVSPTNKIAGSAGRESFLQKRAEVLASSSHWLEIDLLREGARLVHVNTGVQYDYSVRLSRANDRGTNWLWPIRLHQRLPVIHIPLKGDDPDAKLDLQAALDTAYDRAGYDLDIDYKKEPESLLSPELAAWADQWLRSKGLR